MESDINVEQEQHFPEPVSISLQDPRILSEAISGGWQTIREKGSFEYGINMGPRQTAAYLNENAEGFIPGALRGVLTYASNKYPDESVIEIKTPENSLLLKAFKQAGITFDFPLYIIQDGMPQVMRRPFDFNKPESINSMTSHLAGAGPLRDDKEVDFIVTVPSESAQGKDDGSVETRYAALRSINKFIMSKQAKRDAEKIADDISKQISNDGELLITPLGIRAFITQSLLLSLFPGVEFGKERSANIASQIEGGIEGLTKYLLQSVFKSDEDNENLLKTAGATQVMKDFMSIYKEMMARKGEGADFVDKILENDNDSVLKNESFRQAATILIFEASIGSTNYSMQNLFRRMAEDDAVFEYVKACMSIEDGREKKRKLEGILRAAVLDSPPVDLTFRQVMEGDQVFYDAESNSADSPENTGRILRDKGLIILNTGNAVRKNLQKLKKHFDSPNMSFHDLMLLINGDHKQFGEYPSEFNYLLGYPWNRFTTNTDLDSDNNRQCWGEGLFLSIGRAILEGIFSNEIKSFEALGRIIHQTYGPTSGYNGRYKANYSGVSSEVEA